MLTFKEFKAKLEDACLYAINHNKIKIQSNAINANCCCPLGVKERIKEYCHYPNSARAARIWNIHRDEASAFILGFSNFSIENCCNENYYNLGILYRNKFG